jgi:hypothetical protein
MRLLIICLVLAWSLSGCRPDPCETVVCQNGGTCVDGSCQCTPGFRGPSCEFFEQIQLTGTYSVAYTGCFVTSPQHNILIEPLPGNGDGLVLYDLGDYACPAGRVRLEATLSGNTLTVASQEIACGPITYTFSGSGTFDAAGVLTLDFSVGYLVDGIPRTDVCQAVLTR